MKIKPLKENTEFYRDECEVYKAMVIDFCTERNLLIETICLGMEKANELLLQEMERKGGNHQVRFKHLVDLV